jgi:hypothetical protein
MMIGTLGCFIATPFRSIGLPYRMSNAAVDEHRDRPDSAAAARRRQIKHINYLLVVQEIPVHRGEETDRAQAFIECPLRVVDGVFAGRVEHEEADETIRVVRHGERNRVGIAREARDQRGLLHAVLVELGNPSRAKRVDGLGEFPAEIGEVFRIGEPGEETG